MDGNQFDFLARSLSRTGSRRASAVLLGLGLATLGLHRVPSVSKAKSGRKNRCRRRGETCGAGKPCCATTSCVNHTCCPEHRLFVECSIDCLCRDDQNLCCAGTKQAFPTCQSSQSRAKELCCPAENVCGDVCCDPVTQRCEHGDCVCKDEFICNETLCCSEVCRCDAVMGCVLKSDGTMCPSGAGGFQRVRRAPLAR